MRKINNRKCYCCGKIYTYCPSCAEDVNKPAWMALYDNDNCQTIWFAIADYKQGVINKDEAKKILEKCDLSDNKNFEKKIIDGLDEILAEEKVETPIKEKVNKVSKKETKKID